MDGYRAPARKILRGLANVLLLAFLLATMSMAMVYTPGHAQEPEVVLYEEHFDDGQAQDWDLNLWGPGTWVVQRNALVGEGHVRAGYLESYSGDGRMTFEFTLKSLTGGMHFNVFVNGVDRYAIGFRYMGGESLSVYLLKGEGEAERENTIDYLAHREHRVSVVIEGGQIDVYVVKVGQEGLAHLPVITYRDPDPLPGGTFDFETLERSSAIVDDVVVIGPPPPETDIPIPPPPETGVSIPPTTKVMDGDTFGVLASVSEDQVVFEFDHMTDLLKFLQRGDILVGDATSDLAPYGFLRRVNEVYTRDGRVIVETEQGTMGEAIEQGALDLPVDLDLEDVAYTSVSIGVRRASVNLSPLRESFSLGIDKVLVDDDGDLGTTHDQIRVKGNINLDPDLNFRLRIQDGQVAYLEYGHSTTVSARLDLVTEIDIVDVHPKKEIARYVFMPKTVWIGFVPVVLTPEMVVYVGLDGNVSVGITTGIEQEATLRAGATYDGGAWTPYREFDTDFEHTPPTLTGNCSAKAYVGPEISLKIYGVAGPYGDLQGYLELEANPSDVPWWELWAGIEANIGVKVEVLSHVLLSYEETVIDYKEPLAQADTGVVVTPDKTTTEGGEKGEQPCTSQWWPPRCWPWWVWLTAIVVIIIIIIIASRA